MSVNQSRAERSEQPQYRKTGRSGTSGSQRNLTGGKGGGGGTAPPPSLSSNRSFKKSNNAQGGQSRVGTGSVSSDSAAAVDSPRSLQNGAQSLPPLHGAPDAPATSFTVKPMDASTQKSTRGVPKAPASNAYNITPSTVGPSTPAKITQGAGGFSLQFGSISPGFMNGMQVPARTSSAPPNLDEQKRDQTRHDLLKAAAPALPTPPIPKQLPPTKNVGRGDQPNAAENHPMSKSKRDVQVSAGPPASQTQKPPSVRPLSGVPMQVPHHQLQVPVQFGGSNPQLQSQGMVNASLPMPMPMPLPMGNPSQVQQHIFLPGLQPHLIQTQGMMHQGQNMNFTSQMGTQFPPQMGLGITPQFPQQHQAGKYAGARKTTVKITHPETREELRLDGGPLGPRSHPNVPPQSQPIPSFAPAHPVNYYPNSYNSSSPLFLSGPPNSVPLTGSQIPPGSQAPRFYNQVSQGPPTVSFMPSSLSSFPVKTGAPSHGIAESSTLDHAHDLQIVISSSPPSASIQVTVKPAANPPGEKGADDKSGPKIPKPVGEAAPLHISDSEKPTSVVCSTTEATRMEILNRSDTNKDEQKKEGEKGPSLPQNQVAKTESAGVGSTRESTETVGADPDDVSLGKENQKPEEIKILEESKDDFSLTSSASVDQTERDADREVKSSNSETGSSKTTHLKLEEEEEPVVSYKEDEAEMVDALISGTSSLNLCSSTISNGDKASSLDTSTGRGDSVGPTESPTTESGTVTNSNSTDLLKDKSLVEPNRGKNVTAKGRKKRKEAIQKADRAGTTLDLYMAYKGPEEKKETAATPAEVTESVSGIVSKHILAEDNVPNESKVEPDDWEDAADISTPKLESPDDGKRVGGENGNPMAKKYSKDFLLKFLEQYKDLPEGFEITSKIAEVFIVSNGNVPLELYPSPGRNIDRSASGSRVDRRGNGMGGDDGNWNKFPGPLTPGRDPRMDTGYGGNVGGFRPGQAGNYGVQNPRMQLLAQHMSGILSGPMQSMVPQGGMMRRNSSDSDRWVRLTDLQKGLIPSPQTPMQVMHKAERKYLVGNITDEEQAKQRLLKGILNKLTPQNFEKLFEQVKQVNIDNAGTLSGVISQIFDKALMEPTFCEMYANFCSRLAVELPDFSKNNEKITFKRLLLNKCQEEFERGEREQEEANRAEEEGEAKQSEEEREEKRIRARRRMLGNIRLIGELYKEKMLTERIMHECINKLLGQSQNPDEEDVEALCKLMSTIGEMIDHLKAKEHMDFYFDMMARLSNNMKLSSRVRFMLKDSIDLRKNKWQQRRKVEGPKKIEEVHRDAANERQAQASRLARGPSMGSSFRRGQQQPMDFAPRGSNMLSPNSQIGGGFRGMPQQPRGYGNQDVRTDERHPFGLPHRSLGDDSSITLGPQGGLARGMSIRGQPSMPNNPYATGVNGHNSVTDRPAYVTREEPNPRFGPDRFVNPGLDRNMSFGTRESWNPDRGFDRSRPNTPPTRSMEPTSMGNVSSDKVFPEERLRDMSMEAIKEFYSAKDEKEVVHCVSDLKAPSFYPSMISIWVTDSFERKDMDRDLLAKLLINLTKSEDAMLSQDQLVKGFELVLAGLEDAVNDAPKAAEFLGGIFVKVILENVVPMKEIGRLIYEGGEEQGRLVEIGLAAEVLGSVLEIIKSEKGDPILKEICTGSALRLENFRPPNSKKPLRLDKFI